MAKRCSKGDDEEVESDVIVAGKRKPSADLVLVSDGELTIEDSEVQPQDVEEAQLQDVEDMAADATSPALLLPHSQPATLPHHQPVGFLEESQRLDRIKIAEAATRPSHKGFNQRDLAEAVQTAVAALAAPRRKASADASIAEGPCRDSTFNYQNHDFCRLPVISI